mgnify:CR=1 FL=1
MPEPAPAMTSAGPGGAGAVVHQPVGDPFVKRHLAEVYSAIQDIRTAVLWYKACSTCAPDYFVQYLPDSPWIHQPFEVYDNLRPDGLKARLAR